MSEMDIPTPTPAKILTLLEQLQQQVDIRGTNSPFGKLAKGALDEIAKLSGALERIGAYPMRRADEVSVESMREIARLGLSVVVIKTQ